MNVPSAVHSFYPSVAGGGATWVLVLPGGTCSRPRVPAPDNHRSLTNGVSERKRRSPAQERPMNTFQLTNSRRRTVRRIYRVHRGKRCPPRRLGLAFRRCRLQWIQSAIGSHAQRKRHLRLPPFGLLSGVVQGRTRALRSKTQPATRHSEGQAHATRQPRSLRPAASRRARAAVRLAAQPESEATTLPVELPHGPGACRAITDVE